VDIFQFFWNALAWTVSVAVLCPLTTPMAALAFRIWRETRETDVEGSELWIRSFLSSFLLALLSLAFVVVDYCLAELAELPPGPVHLLVFIGFIALSAPVMVYTFSLEDYFQGLSMSVIYLAIPVIALFLLNGMLGFINSSLRFWDPVVGIVKYCLKNPVGG
jgi:hypothetical protein